MRLSAGLFFLIFTILVCFGIVFRGEVLFTGDNFDLLFPQKEFWRSEVRQGRIPLWNPYILSGTPYLADINLGTFSPTNLLYLIIPGVEKAASYLFFFELFLIGFFTYLCAKNYQLSEVSSVISGLVFAYSGVALAYVTNLAIFNVIFYLPILVFLIEKTVKRKSFRLLLLSATFFSFQILSGHAQLTFYTGLFLGSLVLLSPRIDLKFKLKILSVLFIISLGLTSFQLFPFVELAKNTSRVGQGYFWATQGSLTFFDLFKFIIPKFAWNFVFWSDFSSKVSLGYIGVVPFLLFLIGFFSKSPIFRKFKIIAFVSLILSLGANTPFYKLAYYLIPGISFLRVPSQFIAVYSFCAAIICGFGYEKLPKLLSKLNFSKIYLNLLGRGSLLAASLLLISSIFFIRNIVIFDQFYKSGVWFINALFMLTLIFLFIFSICLPRTQNAPCVSIAPNAPSVSPTQILCWISSWVRGLLKAGKLFLGRTLIIFLIMIDLFLTAKAVVLTAPIGSLNLGKVTENVFPEERSKFKIYTIPPELKPEKSFFSPEVEEEFAREKKKLLLPNQNIDEGLIALDGYASMALASYISEFTDASKTVTGLGNLDLSRIDFQKYAVKYLISQKRIPFFEDRGVLIKEDPLIFKLEGARNRYFLEKEGEVKLIKEDPNQLVFETSSNFPNQLIILDSFYPGWKAYLDNQEVAIAKFEHIFRSIDLPKGRQVVRLQFEPESLSSGLIISGLFLVITIFLFLKNPNLK